MKFDLKNAVPLGIVLLTGAFLRLWFGGDFEFKFDQMTAVAAAQTLPKNPLAIAQGMVSSAGLANPPGFYQALYLFGFGGHTPEYFAGCFTLISVLVLPLMLLLKEDLGEKVFPGTWMLAAAAPMLIYLRGNIWAQALLIPLSVVLLHTLTAFVAGRGERYFNWSLVIVLVMGSIHLSGFFLLPALVAIRFKRRFSPRVLWWGALAAAALFGYYLYAGLYPSLSAYRTQALDFAPWRYMKSIGINFGCGIAGYLFEGDAARLLGLRCSTLVAGVILYGAWIFGAGLFALGCVRAWRERKMLPVAIWVALELVAGLAATYAILCISMNYFYWFPAIIPACAVAAYGAGILHSEKIRKILLFTATGFGLASSYLLLDYLSSAGGHYHEYGISYARHAAVLDYLEAHQTPPGPLLISIRIPRDKTAKAEPKVLTYLYQRWFRVPGPVRKELVIDWRDDRYVLRVSDKLGNAAEW